MRSVSVIVPVYNVEKTIRRCVDSLLAQTFADFELILVDDGSPDNCGVICDEYAQKDPRIRVIHQENQSLSVARNVGVAAAKCELISFVDSDDAVHPRLLELLYGALQSTGAVMAASDALECEDMGDFLSQERGHAPVEFHEIDEAELVELYKRPYIPWTAWAKLIPRSILQKYPFEKGRTNQDNAVAGKWLFEAGRVAVVPEKLYFYWINPEGISKRAWNKKRFFDAKWALAEMTAFFHEKQMDILFQNFARQYCMGFAEQYYRSRKTDPALAKEIKKTVIQSWKKWGREVRLPEYEKQYVMGMLHPLYEMAYEWTRYHFGKH